MTEPIPADLTTYRLTALIGSGELVLRVERKSSGTIKTYGDGLRRYLRWCAEHGAEPMNRTGEVVALEVRDLDLVHGLVYVRRGRGGIGRFVPIGAAAIETCAAASHCETDTGSPTQVTCGSDSGADALATTG